MENKRQLVDVGSEEAVFRRLAETTTAALFLVHKGTIRYANPASTTLTHYPPEDLIGKELCEILHHEDRADLRLSGSHREGGTSGEAPPDHGSFRFLTKEGSETKAFVTIAEMDWRGQPAWLLTAFPPSRLPGAQGDRQGVGEFSAIFNSISDAVIVFNTEQIVQRANPAAIASYGFDPTGMKEADLIQKLALRYPDGKPIRNTDLPSQQSFNGNAVYSQRLVFTDSSGRDVTINDSAAPLHDENGDLSGAVVTWHDVTELEHVMSQLDSERLLLKTILENAPEAILVADKRGRIVLTNAAADQLYGWKDPLERDVLAVGEIQVCYPDGTPYEPRNLPLQSSALYGEIHREVELLVVRPDGRRRDVLVSSAAIRDLAGNLNGAVAVCQDITERKQAQEQARKHSIQSEVMVTLTQAFAEAGLDYQTLLDTISRKTAELIGDACVIRMISEDGQQLEPVAVHSIDPVTRTAVANLAAVNPIPVGEGFAGGVFQCGEPLLLPFVPRSEARVSLEPDLSPWVERAQVHSLLIVPLRTQKRQLGTLGMLRFQPLSPFNLDDQQFFQTLANRAALAIENAQLYQAEAQRAREFNALHTATAALLTTLDLETLLGRILDAAISAIPSAERCALHLVMPDTGHLELRAALGYSDPRIKRIVLSQGQGEVERAVVFAVRECKPIRVRPEAPGKRDPSRDPAEEVRSAIVAPLVLGRQVLGALTLDSRDPAAFNENDLRLLVSFAMTTTTAIYNARLHRQVQQQAVTDALTNLYNRRGFFELARRELERAHRFERPLSVLMVDIDHFKNINDSHSHQIGDQVLQGLADILKNNLREVDIIGRYGGEEFAILLPETSLFTACSVAERLRQSIEKTPIVTEKGPISITVSLGVSKASQNTPDLEALLNQADVALYEAKQAGRNRIDVR